MMKPRRKRGHRRHLWFVILVTSLVTSPLSGRAPTINAIDDEGLTVHLSAHARRIVTLSPHATELVFAAGAGDTLVGAASFSNYPPRAKRIPRVGDASRLDRERVLALRPDLIVAWPSGNRPQDLTWLEQLGIAVYRSEPRDLQDIAGNIRDIGRLAGTESDAKPAAEAFSIRLADLRRKYAEKTPLSVFYQIWSKPLMTVGAGHLINRVLRLCGGRPLFPDLMPLTPTVSREAVILGNPQAIVAALPEQGDDDPFAQWRHWTDLEAVRDNRLIKVDPDLIHRPTPRILDGAETVCHGLHDTRPGGR